MENYRLLLECCVRSENDMSLTRYPIESAGLLCLGILAARRRRTTTTSLIVDAAKNTPRRLLPGWYTLRPVLFSYHRVPFSPFPFRGGLLLCLAWLPGCSPMYATGDAETRNTDTKPPKTPELGPCGRAAGFKMSRTVDPSPAFGTARCARLRHKTPSIWNHRLQFHQYLVRSWLLSPYRSHIRELIEGRVTFLSSRYPSTSPTGRTR